MTKERIAEMARRLDYNESMGLEYIDCISIKDMRELLADLKAETERADRVEQVWRDWFAERYDELINERDRLKAMCEAYERAIPHHCPTCIGCQSKASVEKRDDLYSLPDCDRWIFAMARFAKGAGEG